MKAQTKDNTAPAMQIMIPTNRSGNLPVTKSAPTKRTHLPWRVATRGPVLRRVWPCWVLPDARSPGSVNDGVVAPAQTRAFLRHGRADLRQPGRIRAPQCRENAPVAGELRALGHWV